MASLTAVNPKLVQFATTPQIVEVYAAAGTTGTSVWKAGEFLRINSSGSLVAITDAASSGGITHQAITNRSNGDAAGYVKVMKIEQGMVFEMNCKDDTVSEANLNQCYDIDVTSNVCTVDISASTTDTLKVVDLGYLRHPELYTSADTQAIVYVEIPTAIREATAA